MPAPQSPRTPQPRADAVFFTAVSALDTHDSTGGTSLTISNAAEILSDCHLGDSISVNGVLQPRLASVSMQSLAYVAANVAGTCLTVTEFTSDTFKVGVAPETLRRTNLGELKEGHGVNLERAVAGHVRFGGHFVQVRRYPGCGLILPAHSFVPGPCRHDSDDRSQDARRKCADGALRAA